MVLQLKITQRFVLYNKEQTFFWSTRLIDFEKLTPSSNQFKKYFILLLCERTLQILVLSVVIQIQKEKYQNIPSVYFDKS